MSRPRDGGRPPAFEWVKGVAEQAAARSGLVALAERAHRGDVAILSYHNVVPHGEPQPGDRSLHLPVARFEAHLDMLSDRYDVISLDDVTASPEGRARGGAERVVLTFDDAYAGAVHVALPILAARELPATVFVSPGLLDGHAFWWDRLADPSTGSVPPPVRRHALHELRGDDASVDRWARERGLVTGDPPAYARSAMWEDVRRAATRAGLLVGAHGWGHRNFAALDGAELREELERPASWLDRALPDRRPWVAYPYGLTSPRVVSAAARTYTLGLRIDGGPTPATALHARAHELPRINVPAGLSAAGLRLRIAGLLGRSAGR